MSKHKFPYRWNLSDGYPAPGIEYHGSKVFGTFVCGGGSTMGYKLAGYDHLGGVEIDPKIAEIYRVNHKPQHLYVEDIRAFNEREDLPPELYDLDLLDGSPPCSSFSMSGNRDKDWGKEKQFSEGQAYQRLDDLVFNYIDTIEKLKPKVAILENVKGLVTGNAKSYAKRLKQRFESIGYKVQAFLLNSASMGVPQRRERVFFIGHRDDFRLPPLLLDFNEPLVRYKEIKTGQRGEALTEESTRVWNNKISSDKRFSDVHLRISGVGKRFNVFFVRDHEVPFTVCANGVLPVMWDSPHQVPFEEVAAMGTFPGDFKYLFPERPSGSKVMSVVGMSVPPVMAAQISHQIWLQWLSKIQPQQEVA